MRSKRILAILVLGVCLLELGSAAAAATTAAAGQHRSLLEEANTTSSTASAVVLRATQAAAADTAVSTANVDTVVSTADVGTAVSTESVELSSKHSKWHEPRDGRDGRDGKDGDDGPRGPAGLNGKPGKPGNVGATGADGQALTYRYVTTDVATKTVKYDAATGQTDFAGTMTAGAKCARGFHARACSCDTGMDPAFESFISQTDDGGYPDSTNLLGSSNVRIVESRLVAMDGKHQNACACMALYMATVGPDEGESPSSDEGEYDDNDADDADDDDEKGYVHVVKVNRSHEKGSQLDRPQLSRSEYYDNEDDFADDASYKSPGSSKPPSPKHPKHKDYKEEKPTGGDYDPHSKPHSRGEEYQKHPEHKEHPDGKDYHKYEGPSKETYSGDGKGPGSYSGGQEGEYGYDKERQGESHEPHRGHQPLRHPPSGKSVYDKVKQGKWGLPPHLYKPVPYKKEYYSSKQHEQEHYTVDRHRRSSGGYKKGPYADHEASEDGHNLRPSGPYKPQPPRHVYEAIPPKGSSYPDKGNSYPDKGASHPEPEKETYTDREHYPDIGPMKPEDLDDAPDEPYQHAAPPTGPKPLPPYDEYSSDDHGRYSHHAPGSEAVRYHGGRAKKPRRRDSPYYTKGTKRVKRNRAKNAKAWVSGSKKDSTDDSAYLDIVVAQWPSEQSFMLSATAVCVKEGSN